MKKGSIKDPQSFIHPVPHMSFVTGAAMMMHISTFELIGGFREDLFLYWEDVDLSLRAGRAGVRMELVPDARVWHAEGGSAESRSVR